MTPNQLSCTLALCRVCRISLGILLIVLLPPQTGALQTQTQCPLDAFELFQRRTCRLVVDDVTTEAGGGRPTTWTHEPFCVVLPDPPREKEGESKKKVVVVEEKTDKKFCVYTSSTYNGNRGVSLVTTPETAASAVEAVQNPWPAWRHGGHAEGADEAERRRAQPAYELQPVEDKGKGVVATRLVRQFETIMTAFPALIVDEVFFPRNGTQPAETTELLRLATDQLGDRRRVLGLANTMKGYIVDDIIRTNAFGYSLNGRSLRGLYPEVARINHGCDPNAVARSWDNTLEMHVIATRDIQPGEEIVISYIPLGLPSMHRTLILAQQWNFHCACPMCLAFPDEKRKSDKRRERILEIQYLLHQKSITVDELKTMTSEFFELVDKERLTTKLGEYYSDFMTLYFAWDDVEESIKYGELALKWLDGFGTQDSNGVRAHEVRGFLKWLKARKKSGKKAKKSK